MFAVGDKVVRIRPSDSKCPECGCRMENCNSFTKGQVHAVSGFQVAPQGDYGILLDGGKPLFCTGNCYGKAGYDPDSFRKIQPCEPEFIELLNRIKPKVDA